MGRGPYAIGYGPFGIGYGLRATAMRYGLGPMGFGLCATRYIGYRLRATGYSYGLWAIVWAMVRAIIYGLWVMGCVDWAMGYGL